MISSLTSSQPMKPAVVNETLPSSKKITKEIHCILLECHGFEHLHVCRDDPMGCLAKV